MFLFLDKRKLWAPAKAGGKKWILSKIVKLIRDETDTLPKTLAVSLLK